MEANSFFWVSRAFFAAFRTYTSDCIASDLLVPAFLSILVPSSSLLEQESQISLS